MNKLFITLFAILWTTAGFSQTPDTAARNYAQGLYFAKKTYTRVAIPAYEQIKTELPQPVYDENPLWVECYHKAWELAFRHFYEPTDSNGFVSPYFDAAFNNNIFLWDGSFVTMFANYAHPMINSIEGLDNFYIKQYADGEICREISRIDGSSYWLNHENRMCSRWGFVETGGTDFVTYVGREAPTPPPVLTLDALNHPILAWAEWESFMLTGNRDRLALVWEPLTRYYGALKKYLRQGNGLYITDWASMDNSSRNGWLDDGGTAIDISAEMAMFARNLEDIARVLGKKDSQRFYRREAVAVSAIINRKMWDNNRKFYFDLNLSEEKCPIKTVAGFWTLIAGVASKQQAEYLSKELSNPATFGRKYPIPTLAADEDTYFSDGDYWCGAVWAPTNTMVIRGLEKYGYSEQAREIALKHIAQVAGVYKTTGTIWENYSADTLLYGRFRNGKAVKGDFVGWSGIGPIMYLLEYAVGLKPDAANNTLNWNIRSTGNSGCAKYRFNGHTVSLLAKPADNRYVMEIVSDGDFKLNITVNGQKISKNISKGKTVFSS
jgi:glycogen debranching enzyme